MEGQTDRHDELIVPFHVSANAPKKNPLVLVLQNMEETELLKEKEDETNTFGLENQLATFFLFIQKLVFCFKYMNQFFG
jgi:hypothetical protein